MAINGRSYAISAGVDVQSADAEGVLYAHGGVAGGHSFYIKDRKLHYAFNWLARLCRMSRGRTKSRSARTCTRLSSSVRDQAMILTCRASRARRPLHRRPSCRQRDVVTQPGPFCLIGDGICVGRDSASPVTPDYADRGTFAFSGGTIDRVIVDVSGEKFVDHEATVRGWFIKD